MRLVSTRNSRVRATFVEAVEGCVPDGGGLFIPDPLPCFRDVPRLLEMDFLERAVEILHRLLGDEFSHDELEEVVRETMDFPLPLRQLRERVFTLELFHGPTGAFQDFGARFMAGMLALISDKRGLTLRTVLTATTGNTGTAAAHAFWKRRGFRVVSLHPAGRLTPLQERQVAGLGGNVLSYAIEGPYEACRLLLDQCFADRELAASLHLTSANSLNIARILAQIPLFFEAVARLKALSLRDAPVLALPCGSLGSLYAGLLAQKMGLPVKAFVAATTENEALAQLLETGNCASSSESTTSAQALDIGVPAGWERLLACFGGDLDALRSGLRWGHAPEAAIRKSMWEMNASGQLPDPNTAVAHSVLQERLGLTEVGVLLGTAHPAKSRDLLATRMNLTAELPPTLAAFADKAPDIRTLSPDYAALKAALLA